MPTTEVPLRSRPANRMTPTLAIQMLGLGCPKAYHLRHEHPEQPSSAGNAFGTLYHLGRQLCESKSQSEVGFLRSQWGLRSILGKFTDASFFRHGIATRDTWEMAAMEHYLDQVFRFLWFHHKLVSVKSYGEALARHGTNLVWWDTELRLPVLDLNWLTNGTGVAITEGEKWALKGAIDLIILTEHDGRYFVRVIDHKLDGIDVHEELNGRDCRLQLNLYACWAMQAFRDLGITPEDISLWIHKLTLNPMGLQVINLPFNRQIYLETLDGLGRAIETYQGFRRSGFPAQPTEYLCQGCDFGFSPLCPESMAKPNAWNVGVPYVPLAESLNRKPGNPARDAEVRKTGVEETPRCEACGAPKKKGCRLPWVCSQPMYDDCPREDR